MHSCCFCLFMSVVWPCVFVFPPCCCHHWCDFCVQMCFCTLVCQAVHAENHISPWCTTYSCLFFSLLSLHSHFFYLNKTILSGRTGFGYFFLIYCFPRIFLDHRKFLILAVYLYHCFSL